MTAGLPLTKSILTFLTKNVLLPLRLSAGMSAADAAIQNKKKIMDQAVIISNEEIENIMKKLNHLKNQDY